MGKLLFHKGEYYLIIFKFVYRLCFVLSPLVIIDFIIPSFLDNSNYSVVEDTTKMIELDLLATLIVFVVIYFMHKYMGKAIIFAPFLLGFIVLLDNLNTNFKNDSAIFYYWYELPLLQTVTVYSIGFFVNDFYSKNEI